MEKHHVRFDLHHKLTIDGETMADITKKVFVLHANTEDHPHLSCSPKTFPSVACIMIYFDFTSGDTWLHTSPMQYTFVTEKPIPQ